MGWHDLRQIPDFALNIKVQPELSSNALEILIFAVITDG
jgi:hypothetical protein